ncbi:aromatic ring-hydroxylating dioxygenase subunit alpha [Marinobacterium sedimentorum]|uniref:aromatic ring-hydroxylating dioxygenase subunit alpha n=1 Tax=Marinobacterium sedimentorum TaxID=2927804 RepID=UPI0020C64A00|nr:aromatic ring-hydroxylating dioxygenase subunit alpha [Marinobacterium sedimentorum]MCP8687683.1 aromatic ring-hydroxylating dioxygenase subunit alpha [Marinobacterium sedimentorum]
MNDKQSIESYLDLGLRNRWYPVVASWEVATSPVGITRLGDNIVLWRDRDGQVHALEDRCPHRGARLSLGWNLGDRVACWYHGVEVRGDGEVADVPAISNCPMSGTKCVRSYPVIEKHGAVFVWFGLDASSVPDDLVLPEQLESDNWSSFLCTADWACNHRYAVDNVMDPMHGSYLHGSSHSMAEGERSADMRVVDTEHGFRFEKVGQSGVNFDWVEFGDSGTFWLRLSIPYQQKFGPGGEFWIVGQATPIDANNTRVFFWRARQVQGWQRDTWRFLYRNRLEKLHWDVLVQDQIILEQMAPDARNHEFLYQHDVGLSRLRRLMKKMAQQQLAQIEAAAPCKEAGADA